MRELADSQARMLADIEQDFMLELFDIDLTGIGGTITRLCNGLNEVLEPVRWKGNVYLPYPVQAEGFEITSEGASNRPSITISNAFGLVTAIATEYGDALRGKVTRRQVYRKHLDAANFAGGNADADTTAEIVGVYRIQRLSSLIPGKIATFELAAPAEADNVLLPRRVIIANTCCWQYRSAECGYTGKAVATEKTSQPATRPKTLVQNVLPVAGFALGGKRHCRLVGFLEWISSIDPNRTRGATIPKRKCWIDSKWAIQTLPQHLRIPEEEFRLHPDDWEPAEAIVHSHPNGERYLSNRDRLAQVRSGLNWWLVVGGEVLQYRCAPLLRGREFEYGVNDCASLVEDAYMMAGVNFTSEPRGGIDEDIEDGKILRHFAAPEWRQVQTPMPGDVLLASHKGKPAHALIYLGDEQVLHHPFRQLSRCEAFSEQWQQRIYAIFRHQDFPVDGITAIQNDLQANQW